MLNLPPWGRIWQSAQKYATMPRVNDKLISFGMHSTVTLKIDLLSYFYTKKGKFMASDCSFDVVSQFDEQELVNAIDQTRREIQTRYDLKDTKTEIAHSKDDITILTDSEIPLKSVPDILNTNPTNHGPALQ